MPKVTTKSRIDKLRQEYEKAYDLSALNSANDSANLEALLKYQIIIEDLQEEISKLMEGGAGKNILEIKKISDAAKDMTDRCMTLERQLGIDRKTRKAEVNTDSPAEYLSKVKISMREFMEQRITKVYCPDCKIMIFRIWPVQDHTKFDVKCECSQCKKMVRVHREERDMFFDLPVKDRQWREKYKYEVIQPKSAVNENDSIDIEDDELRLGGE